MKKLLLAAIALLCVAGSAYATPTVIAEWNFNSLASGQNPTTVAPSSQAFLDATSLFQMSGCSYASSGAYSTQSSSSDGRSSDPTAGSGSTYSAYNTSGYDVAGDKVMWGHSTVGYQNITAQLDSRLSATCPTAFNWVYSTNAGASWTTLAPVTLVNDTKWHNDLTSIVFPAVCNNNANFRVGLAVAGSGGAAGGTLRLDMLQIYGDAAPVPEPGSLLALFTGCVGLIGFICRTRKH